MKLSFKNKDIGSIKADVQIVFLEKKPSIKKLVTEGDLEILEESGFFKDSSECFYVSSSKKLYIKLKEFETEEIKTAAAKAYSALKNFSFKSAKVEICADEELFCSSFAEGVILGGYAFDWYKSEKKEHSLKSIHIVGVLAKKSATTEKKLNDIIEASSVVANSVNFVRDIVNSAPDDATPIQVATIAEKVAKEEGFECKVYDEKFLKSEEMGAFLSVARASAHPPRLVHMSYKPKGGATPAKRVVLIGKGLTYDSGGLSLKPADYMVTMKADKAGACATIGIMQAAAKLNLNVEIHGFLGLCENMIGGNAYKPDDILKAKNGKTIEVRNTDAEGRLVLADVLVFAQEYFKKAAKPFDYMVDMATLTGACVVAVGEYTSGVMGHSEKLKKLLLSSADEAGDLMAPLPFNKHLRKLIKSEIADISNCSSSRYGGAITAAMFLDEFIYDENKQKWAHLDIAGPAYVEKAWDYNPHGASGTPVRTMVEFLKKMQKGN